MLMPILPIFFPHQNQAILYFFFGCINIKMGLGKYWVNLGQFEQACGGFRHFMFVHLFLDRPFPLIFVVTVDHF